MPIKILVLGASYGSLLGTKIAMAGHDVDLVCRAATAELINRDGTEVRIKLRGEDQHRPIRSGDLPGNIAALVPQNVEPGAYDLVVLAMQEPQYTDPGIRTLMARLAAAEVPCLSIMNMPPLSYLQRISALETDELRGAYTDPTIWDAFSPGLVSLCSPDPQAFRPPEESANVLHVALPTNFKASVFEDPQHTAILRRLESDIAAVQLDGKDVPVKLKVHDSLFVPLAKWSMLMAGNYRCILPNGAQSIRDAVHSDLRESRAIYEHVEAVLSRLGGTKDDQVPFEKYAKAAEQLQKPSSSARAIIAGAPVIERVDRLVELISSSLDMPSAALSEIVEIVDAALEQNRGD